MKASPKRFLVFSGLASHTPLCASKTNVPFFILLHPTSDPWYHRDGAAGVTVVGCDGENSVKNEPEPGLYTICRVVPTTSNGPNADGTHTPSASPSKWNSPCRVRAIRSSRPQNRHTAPAVWGGHPQVIHCMPCPSSATRRCAAARTCSKLSTAVSFRPVLMASSCSLLGRWRAGPSGTGASWWVSYQRDGETGVGI